MLKDIDITIRHGGITVLDKVLISLAMTLAFRYAEASRLAPFEYVALLWPLLADLFIFKLQLSTAFLMAVPLILLGAVFAAFEGRKAKG